MIASFSDSKSDLALFYYDNRQGSSFPSSIARQLRRKLSILESASAEKDLRIPPGNHYERLTGNFSGWSSIRVNIQWRLIFRWVDGYAYNVHLDSHQY